MVLRGTRYAGQSFTGVRGKDGKVRKFLHFPDAIGQDRIEPGFVLHTVQQGEEIDEIAFKFEKKPLLWWVIAYVSGLQFPMGIEPGTKLIVPRAELKRLREPASMV